MLLVVVCLSQQLVWLTTNWQLTTDNEDGRAKARVFPGLRTIYTAYRCGLLATSKWTQLNELRSFTAHANSKFSPLPQRPSGAWAGDVPDPQARPSFEGRISQAAPEWSTTYYDVCIQASNKNISSRHPTINTVSIILSVRGSGRPQGYASGDRHQANSWHSPSFQIWKFENSKIWKFEYLKTCWNVRTVQQPYFDRVVS